MPIASRMLSAFWRASLLAALTLTLTLPGLTTASDDVDDEASFETMKQEWQSRYRRLLVDARLLRSNAEAARTNYSKAKRRNYPRGPAREQFLVDEEKALKELATIEAEIEATKADGRRAGALPGWFYEVEEGPLDPPQPAARAEDDPRDREGRNPLYLDSE